MLEKAIATLGGVIAVTAMLLLISAILPNMTARGVATIRARHLTCFLVGVLYFLIGFLIARCLKQTPEAVGGVVVTILVIPLLIGLAGVCREIGRLTLTLFRKEGSEGVAVVVGSILYLLASLLPLVGWFVVFPYILCVSAGTFFVSIFRRGGDNV